MQEEVLKGVYERLGLDVPETGLLPQRIRIMTMHGAKGLSARVVFIPGLEQSVLPGARRQPYVGLVLEAARLLYVSITRARAACIVSRAKTRFVNGSLQMQAPSKFASQMGGPFLARTTGFVSGEVQAVLDQCALLG